MLGRRSTLLALLVAVGALFGCAGGDASGTIRSSSAGSGGGPTGPSGPTGPVIGAPAARVVYTLVTSDNRTATPTAEVLVGETISAGAALAPIAATATTRGTGGQWSASSGLAASPDKTVIFAGHNLDQTVESFLTKTDGTLVAAPGAPLAAGQATSIAVHPTLAVIYVSSTSPSAAASTVSVFTWNRTTGALSAGTPLTTADSLRGIAVDPGGRFLVTTHMFGAGTGVALYALDAQGAPLSSPIVSVAQASRPASAAFDRTGAFLYVRNLDDGIYAYSVSLSGLTALNGGTAYAVGGFCSDLAVSGSIDYLYALLPFTGEIHAFHIGAAGDLTAGAVTALNDDCEHMSLGRHGNDLFVTSRAKSQIRAFAVDASTGGLTENAASPYAVSNPAGVTGAIVVDD
jgi:6-phosphogluconolactonase (cycloisomerase 2 family)